MEKKNSVLIVDDERVNIITLTRMLGGKYTVYAATDGLDAMETAIEFNPDIILLDIIMPDMDGYEVLSRLKNEEKTKDIPVVFITGLGSTHDEEKGISMGAASYIKKPFDAAVVEAKLQDLIQLVNSK
jgi:CheY-like chemotaxis protein